MIVLEYPGIELLAGPLDWAVAVNVALAGLLLSETHLCSYLLRALCESRELRKRGALG